MRERERERESERESEREKERGGGKGYLIHDFRALFWPCRSKGLPGFASRRWSEIGRGERVVGR